jgi:hypothetical protein
VAFCDRRCNVIAPFVVAPGNHSESPMLRDALPQLMKVAREAGLALRITIISLDGAYDCRMNRKALFDPVIFKECFNTIERLFGWEDEFRRLLLRFERLSHLLFAFKALAYTMINPRHYFSS